MALQTDAAGLAESLAGCAELSGLALQGSTAGFDMSVSGRHLRVSVHMMDPGTSAKVTYWTRSGTHHVNAQLTTVVLLADSYPRTPALALCEVRHPLTLNAVALSTHRCQHCRPFRNDCYSVCWCPSVLRWSQAGVPTLLETMYWGAGRTKDSMK